VSEPRVLELMTLNKVRLQRDLLWLVEYSKQHPELTMEEMLEQLHEFYKHYLSLDAFVRLSTMETRKETRS
jgi:hypothetical protein